MIKKFIREVIQIPCSDLKKMDIPVNTIFKPPINDTNYFYYTELVKKAK